MKQPAGGCHGPTGPLSATGQALLGKTMIWIRFSNYDLSAELYSALDDNDQPTGKLALFAKHAGQVGFAAEVRTDCEKTLAKLTSLGYRHVALVRSRRVKCTSTKSRTTGSAPKAKPSCGLS